jgi:hypothetical protein
LRRALVAVGVATVFLAAGAPPAGATNECRGLMICVPVAGPWVVVPPGRAAPRPRAEFQLTCPRRYVVGGLDAELSDRAIDVSFLGLLGSPVNPGITTSTEAVFLGVYSGPPGRMTSFRPHIGCMPTSGGGGRPPASVQQAFPPGRPTVRRVWTVQPRAGIGINRVRSCAPGERLLASSHAVGFFTQSPPARALMTSVQVTRRVRAGRISFRAFAEPSFRGRAVVQVHAVCSRSGR